MSADFLISIVDDDAAVRKSLESFFKSLGFNVSTHAQAEDLLNALKKELSHCLILDVGLEGMSGPDLQRELLSRGYAIPIVFITANASDATQKRVMSDGAVDFLMKPFGEDELLAAIHKALQLLP